MKKKEKLILDLVSLDICKYLQPKSDSKIFFSVSQITSQLLSGQKSEELRLVYIDLPNNLFYLDKFKEFLGQLLVITFSYNTCKCGLPN